MSGQGNGLEVRSPCGITPFWVAQKVHPTMHLHAISLLPVGLNLPVAGTDWDAATAYDERFLTLADPLLAPKPLLGNVNVSLGAARARACPWNLLV
jgi:hypothetical protein